MSDRFTLNRSDLSWGLTATLPHTGSPNRDLDFVGYDSGKLYALDGYTIGVATVGSAGPPFRLPVKEAKELLRFVRPERVAHRQEDVTLLHTDAAGPGDLPGEDETSRLGRSELHVLLQDGETAVFDTNPPGTGFQPVRLLIDKLRAAPQDLHPELPFYPDFAARFAKASRQETDRLILGPRSDGGLFGAALVTVGERFVGAIAGLSYEPVVQMEAA